MAELADAPDLGSGIERCAGSSPVIRTNIKFKWSEYMHTNIIKEIEIILIIGAGIGIPLLNIFMIIYNYNSNKSIIPPILGIICGIIFGIIGIYLYNL